MITAAELAQMKANLASPVVRRSAAIAIPQEKLERLIREIEELRADVTRLESVIATREDALRQFYKQIEELRAALHKIAYPPGKAS